MGLMRDLFRSRDPRAERFDGGPDCPALARLVERWAGGRTATGLLFLVVCDSVLAVSVFETGERI